VTEEEEFSLSAFYDALEAAGSPVVTATDVPGFSQADATDALDALVGEGVERRDVSNDPVVYYPSDYAATADRERVVVFDDNREIVVDQPSQFTRARLSQFAHLTDTTRDGAYRYRIRKEDVWSAPYERLDDLLDAIRAVTNRRPDAIEEFVEGEWRRAHQFVLRTHEEGYTVLEARSDDAMGNVARQKLDDTHLRAPISDDTSWVNSEKVAEIKRILYEAGYPVRDERELEGGAPLDFDYDFELRDYQADWVARFEDQGSGVLVGPPGSGKTVAGIGIMEAVGGETLILVPSRELASQWHDNLLDHTTLAPEQIGEYHGGRKELRSVTIATYQTAGMDRHRQLFDSRSWGLIVMDEAHHIPSPVFRRAAGLQSKHRLGLSATPIREDDRETDIYTLVGPPIGTDWDALFDAGFVQEPEIELRYVPWESDDARYEWADAEGHERRKRAASNPAKVAEIRHLLAAHPNAKALIFADYLDQGDELAEELGSPFVSGETPHPRRERLFDQFRSGEREALIVSRVGDEGIDLPAAELAIVASGLGGSRRQGAQRAGRTMRPAGRALVYVLATQGTEEEDHARRRTRHLAEKGVRVREESAQAVAFRD